jgi:hypothetical protein
MHDAVSKVVSSLRCVIAIVVAIPVFITPILVLVLILVHLGFVVVVVRTVQRGACFSSSRVITSITPSWAVVKLARYN